MVKNIVSAGVLSALAGAAMLVASTGTSSAFTLSSPSLEKPVATAGVDHVWWDRWGRWHPNCWWDGWGRRHCPGVYGYRYGFVAPAPYYGYRRHCWRDSWGYRHCRRW